MNFKIPIIPCVPGANDMCITDEPTSQGEPDWIGMWSGKCSSDEGDLNLADHAYDNFTMSVIGGIGIESTHGPWPLQLRLPGFGRSKGRRSHISGKPICGTSEYPGAYLTVDLGGVNNPVVPSNMTSEWAKVFCHDVPGPAGHHCITVDDAQCLWEVQQETGVDWHELCKTASTEGPLTDCKFIRKGVALQIPNSYTKTPPPGPAPVCPPAVGIPCPLEDDDHEDCPQVFANTTIKQGSNVQQSTMDFLDMWSFATSHASTVESFTFKALTAKPTGPVEVWFKTIGRNASDQIPNTEGWFSYIGPFENAPWPTPPPPPPAPPTPK
jgi:hypothetical protein